MKLNFDDYQKRMTASVFPWMLFEPSRREEASTFIDELIDAKRLTPPSLYVGIDPLDAKVMTCQGFVRPAEAQRCVRMAQTIFAFAAPHVLDSPPKIRTKAEDEFFAMKPSVLLSMTNTADFWQYYISCMKSGDAAFEDAVSEYNRKYFAKNTKFKEDGGYEDDAAA